MRTLILYFSLAAGIASLLSVMVLAIFLDLQLALIVSLLVGFIFGLFSVGFTQRTLSAQTLDIHTGNKHPDRPISWYEERVREQISDLGFIFSRKQEDEKEIFVPRGLYKVFEPDIELEVSPYSITVNASRLMIRLISTYVEINLPIEER